MKIYKKSLLYGALAFTLCMAGGCNSNIDLEPEGIITADGYFKSAEDYEKALTALPGVKATVDLTSGTAVVEGDVSDEAIRAAITEAGYTVKGIA